MHPATHASLCASPLSWEVASDDVASDDVVTSIVVLLDASPRVVSSSSADARVVLEVPSLAEVVDGTPLVDVSVEGSVALEVELPSTEPDTHAVVTTSAESIHNRELQAMRACYPRRAT